jgi:hypothetical protein
MPVRRRHKNDLLLALTRQLPEDSFQRRPYFPNLLRQPALLLLPAPGHLAAVHWYDFHERLTWRTALGAVEDLFELKTLVGPHTIVIAAISGSSPVNEDVQDPMRLVVHSFDAVIRDGDRKHPNRWELPDGIVNAIPQERLFPLWLQEAAYQRTVLSHRLRDTDYEPLIHARFERVGHERGA